MPALGLVSFWRKDHAQPEPNADTELLLPVYALMPHNYRRSEWSPEDCKQLQEHVLEEVQVHISTAWAVMVQRVLQLAACAVVTRAAV